MSKVNVFVSSTCYDLSQIRNDIKQCILDLGHNPMLSELKNFPIDTRLTSSENCINAVKNEADIFILIIGNKYGSVLESGKSITNSEFLTAVNKGIPIYTFALKQMTTILPLWEKNPNADFSNVVDNNKVFEFLADVRKKRGLWNFEFEKAQDIVEILKAQFSNLFHDALRVKKAVETSEANGLFQKISSRATDIIMKKEDYYEIRFFLQSLKDEIDKYRDLRNDYEYSILLKPADGMTDLMQIIDWTRLKLRQLMDFLESLKRLTEAFNQFYAEPGVPSDLEGLYYVARSWARAYASLIEWSMEIKSTFVPDEYRDLLSAFADIPEDAIKKIEQYPDEALRKVEESISKEKSGELGTGSTIELTLTVSIGDAVMKRYLQEMENVRNHMFK